MITKKQALAPGTVVQGTNLTYQVDNILGTGAFGITYLATTKVTVHGDLGDIETYVHVTLKEFFVEGKMTRNGSKVERDESDEDINAFARSFYMEADKMSTLSHPNIVKVLEVFVANNTCYYTMEYLPGGTLNSYISKKNGIPEVEALKYTRQIGSALAYMHEKKMVHLDVKPLNMVFGKDKQLMLIDYGLSIQYDNNGEPEATDSFCSGTPGYAPLEQSSAQTANQFAPTMDVYGLGASFYKMLTGLFPGKAVDIARLGVNTLPLVSKKVSQQSIDAIKAAMQPDANKRVQTINDFLAMLPETPAKEKKQKVRNGNNWRKILLYVVSALTISAILYYAFS